MENEAGGDCCSRPALGALFLLLLASAGILAANFPGKFDLRNGDESFYVHSGLAMWEGITPSAKYAPAGPQTWISWVYAAGYSARDFIRPGAEVRAAPGVLKPFVAANQALFDIYRDWHVLREIEVGANDLVFLAAVAAGFGLGWKRAKGFPLAGAILVGGMTAALPLFVRLSGEARPYVMAWSFGIIALYFSAGPRRRGCASAIALGLGIGCRVDMVLLLPLVFADLAEGDGTIGVRVGKSARYTLVVALVVYLIAPWSVTNLIGNLRSIATVGLARPKGGWVSISNTLREIFWSNGLGVVLALGVAGLIFVKPWGRKVAAVYVLLLAASMLKATAWGLQHQGGPVVAVITFSAVGLAIVGERWPRAVWWVVGAAILLPMIQTVRDVHQRRAAYVQDYAVAWLQRHVPAGTIVYTTEEIKNPLPTAAAADAIWDEVNHTGAWTLKVTTSLKRFNVGAVNLPRAFSEEDMILEKGIRRGWYILGSRPTLDVPRYDIRIFNDSPIYSMSQDDVAEMYRKDGGVLIDYDNHGPPPKDVGAPVIEWVNAQGYGCHIYCSGDVMAHLIDAQNISAW